MQAWIDEDLVQQVRNNQIVVLSETLIRIPVNVPVMPNIDDLVTLRRIAGIQRDLSTDAPATETMSVRFIDQGNTLLGFIILHTVRGGST